MAVAVSPTPGRATWRAASGGPITPAYPVPDLSRVGEVRRAADSLGRGGGLCAEALSELAIVVTEAATNLARHARAGEILLGETTATGRAGVEVLAVDAGPGMSELARSFTDGYSTGGSAGAGLGAIRRQSDVLDVYSIPGQGTVLQARVYARPVARGEERGALLDVGVVCRPAPGERVCGDGWMVVQSADRAAVLLVDGLGHGAPAADAADAACTVFRASAQRSPVEVMQELHAALRATRGAAVGVVHLTRTGAGAAVRAVSVGNTVASIVAPTGTRALPSMNGTVGLQMRGLQEFSGTLGGGERLVLHTDGITTRWTAARYPEVLAHAPSVLAALLHRDATRGRDDATVLVLGLSPDAS